MYRSKVSSRRTSNKYKNRICRKRNRWCRKTKLWVKSIQKISRKDKKEYPRLIGADALYASKTVMDICKEKGIKNIKELGLKINYTRG